MYAGTTIRRGSGRFVGVHQKIDRAARRHIKRYIPRGVEFPVIKDIIHFEGINGPDGLKRKSPSIDEPWHYINPLIPDDSSILVDIENHLHNLSVALGEGNKIRSAFEASWLAHAIVDGLTPAHHYPMGDKIIELWGKSHDERSSIKEKNLIHGENGLDTLAKNWEYWGAGGVFTTHVKFEMGVASAIATDRFKDVIISRKDINQLQKVGFMAMYLESLEEIDNMNMFEELSAKGWTQLLARQTRLILVPEMIRLVSLAWYQASISAIESSTV